eukprot:jgi/Mesvir1/23048/Mv08165-RA.1
MPCAMYLPADGFARDFGTDEAFLVQLAHAQRTATAGASMPAAPNTPPTATPSVAAGDPLALVPGQGDPDPWAGVVESLEGAREELAVMIDLLARVEGGRELAVATLPKPRLHGAEAVTEAGARLHGKQRALREVAGVLAEGAEQLRRQAEAEARFYEQLERLQRVWRLRRPATSTGAAMGRGSQAGDADATDARPFTVDLSLPYSSRVACAAAGATKAASLPTPAMPRLVMAPGPRDGGGAGGASEGHLHESARARRRRDTGVSVVVPPTLPCVDMQASIVADDDSVGGASGQEDAASLPVQLAHARLHAAQRGLFHSEVGAAVVRELMEAVRCDPLVAHGGVDVTRCVATALEMHLPGCDAGRTLRLTGWPRQHGSSLPAVGAVSSHEATSGALDGPIDMLDGGSDRGGGAGVGSLAVVMSVASKAFACSRPRGRGNAAGLTDTSVSLLMEQWFLRKMDPPCVRTHGGRPGGDVDGGGVGAGALLRAPAQPALAASGKHSAASHGMGSGTLAPHPMRPAVGLDDLLAMLAHAEARARLMATLDGLVDVLPGLRCCWQATGNPLVTAVQVSLPPTFLAQLKLATATPSSSSSSSARPTSSDVVQVRGRLGSLHAASFLRQLLHRKQGMLPAPLAEMGGAATSITGVSRSQQLSLLNGVTNAQGMVGDAPATVRLAFSREEGRGGWTAGNAKRSGGMACLNLSRYVSASSLRT